MLQLVSLITLEYTFLKDSRKNNRSIAPRLLRYPSNTIIDIFCLLLTPENNIPLRMRASPSIDVNNCISTLGPLSRVGTFECLVSTQALVWNSHTVGTHEIIRQNTRVDLSIRTVRNDSGYFVSTGRPEHITIKLDPIAHRDCTILFPSHIHRECLKARVLHMTFGEIRDATWMESIVTEGWVFGWMRELFPSYIKI